MRIMFEMLFVGPETYVFDAYALENRLRISVFTLSAILAEAAFVSATSEKGALKRAYSSRAVRALKYAGCFGPRNCMERARPIFGLPMFFRGYHV